MQPGNYYAAARTLPCWSLPSNTLHVSLLDIERTATHGTVRLYPNPASDAVTLDCARPLRDGRITLCNAVGQVVHEQLARQTSSVMLSVQGLPAGVYLLKVSDEGRTTATLRLVVSQ
jgi:hypothetical protein